MATVPAILGSARLGNFRLGYQSAALADVRQSRVRITLAGVGVTSRVRVGSLSIHDALNDQPNTCSLTIEGAAPSVGQLIRVTINSDTPRLLFNGALQTVDLSYEGLPAQWVYPCTAIDDLALLNQKLPTGVFTNVSATAIAQALLASFAPGFTGAHIQAGLANESIILDGSEGFSGALAQLAQLIGGAFYVEDLDLHLFTSEGSDPPDTIDATPGRFLDDPPITMSTDSSQLRTRVYGKGHGEATTSAVAAGETVIPIADTSMFNPSGGRAISESQRLAYTSVQAGGSGSVAGPSAAPVVAPGATVTGGGSVDTGDHDYAYVFGTVAGKSLPSPTKRVTTSTTAMAAPAIAPLVTLSSIGAVLQNGVSYQWLLTYGSDLTHETTIGPASAVVVGDGIHGAAFQLPSTPPYGPLTIVNVYRKISGVYYREGQTVAVNLIAPSGPASFNSYPSDANMVATSVQPPVSNTATYASVSVDGIALGPTGTTYREVYRTPVGSAQLKLVTTIANNTSTGPYVDSVADSALGATVPVTDTSGLSTVAGKILAGSTSLLTASAGPFAAAGGWVQNGAQRIRYTGITGNTLTGIPASGLGSIINTITYGEHLDALAALAGVTGLILPLILGAPVNLFVQRDDLAAQAAMAAVEGGDGIHEYLVSDERRGEVSLTALCDAHLTLFSRPIVTVTVDSRDVKTKSGKTLAFNLPSPPIVQSLLIQSADISEIDVAPGVNPRFHVTASTIAWTLDQLLRSALAGLAA